jgi:hypothetical protein
VVDTTDITFEYAGGALGAVVPVFTVATLPPVTPATPSRMIAVSDETGGYTVAFTDGTNWRRVQDRAIVS